MYDTVVYKSRSVELSEYIHQWISDLTPWIEDSSVERLVVQINDSDNSPLERYIIDISTNPSNITQTLGQMESSMRSFLVKLCTYIQKLKSLPKGNSFQLLIYTKKDPTDKWTTAGPFPKANESNLVPLRLLHWDKIRLQLSIESHPNSFTRCEQ